MRVDQNNAVRSDDEPVIGALQPDLHENVAGQLFHRSPFSRKGAKQSQIKIRNPNIEIRNKPKNLNPNYEIPKPFVWNFVVFLII
jgi:hypothetical protein